ncbi:NmrA-like family-domain-containing protein [Penicillium hispanicum]|uniref:NmrA-like family-domain-containing protein n=1 Tax=Penicillium hispanicum TaxID=1080232 RepID=UPI00253FB338|nr:NmrA-like family-domain-containing protein [Penicillium hispanicum]KAJ5566746.1 NmrA-like family-domain-containing protein [Penicillium hispanicum]
MNDLSSLYIALHKTSAVFSMTDFWDTLTGIAETDQGKAVADAAVAAGVSLLIRSSLPNVTQMTNGELTTVHYFDSKAEVEAYIRGLPIPSKVFSSRPGLCRTFSTTTWEEFLMQHKPLPVDE